MQWLFYERLRILLDQLFLDFYDSWQTKVSGQQRVVVCNALSNLLKFIFEPKLTEEKVSISVPNIEIDLKDSINKLLEYIEDTPNFEELLMDWSDYERYQRVYKTIKKDLKSMTNTKAIFRSDLDESLSEVFKDIGRLYQRDYSYFENELLLSSVRVILKSILEIAYTENSSNLIKTVVITDMRRRLAGNTNHLTKSILKLWTLMKDKKGYDILRQDEMMAEEFQDKYRFPFDVFITKCQKGRTPDKFYNEFTGKENSTFKFLEN